MYVDLSTIVKAYDVRGVVGEQWDAEVAQALGAAFAQFVGGKSVVVAHDMRDSSPILARAFAQGATDQGLDVVMAGLASTDMLYFASGFLDMPGAMFTASHNPAQYNGIKMCKAGAAPIGQESGLFEIRDSAQAFLNAKEIPTSARTGHLSEANLLGEYAKYLRGLVDLSGIRSLKVVVDAGNGMAGYTVPTVLSDLPLTVVPLYFELDGNFPNHEANPLEPSNLVDLQRAVREHGADIGLAFDGDADRCFVVDEKGEAVPPSAITALVAVRELEKNPGATIIYNCITSRAVPEIVKEHGGTPLRSRVGHSFIKAEMARTNAVFGGEHSAHYYFKDFWRADTGMLAALHVLAALGSQNKDEARPLSELLKQYRRYVASGEINSTVTDPQGTIAAVEQHFSKVEGVQADHLDGLTIEFADGSWFNVRPSNTEPLLRLNIEAETTGRVDELRSQVLAQVRSS